MSRSILWIGISLLFLTSITVFSQPNPTIITIGLPGDLIPMLNPASIFASLYEAHPNVSVVFVPYPQRTPIVESIIQDAEQHLDDLESLASLSDVLYVGSFEFSVAGTRAGYFLDLAPLVNADSEINPTNYYPSAWNAYRWDGGIWALPIQLLLQFLIYDPQAFTESNLNLPTINWTFDDLAHAADILGGITIFDSTLLARALYNQSIVEDMQPNFATDGMAEALIQIRTLQSQYPNQAGEQFQSSMIVGDIPYLVVSPDERIKRGAPLPGNIVGSRATGLAISAGTPNPEEAYAVARYLTTEPTFISLIGGIPAHRNTAQMLNSFPFRDNLLGKTVDEETRSFLIDALETALPASELNFGNYLLPPLFDPSNANDMLTNLETAQTEAIEILELAESRAETTNLVIPTPVPTAVMLSNEIELLFDAAGSGMDTRSNSSFQAALETFVEQDPEVGRITQIQPSPNTLLPERDCFVQIVNRADMNFLAGVLSLLPVDPLLNSDPNLLREDFLPYTLEQLSVEGQTLGIPLVTTQG